MSYEEEVQKLLNSLGEGRVLPVPYDTAWVARLLEMDRTLGGQAMEWLCNHQLEDGSWGASAPYCYHDRVINTLAAMTGLCRYGKRSMDRRQIERGANALNQLVKGATRGLAEPLADTIGFELIVPTLVAEAEEMGLIGKQGDHILGRFAQHRTKKMQYLKNSAVGRNLSTAFSAEMAGNDHQDLLDIDNLMEDNGSIGCSPAATAYYATVIQPGDEKALAYLQGTLQSGGATHLGPLEGFETPWVIWNLTLGYKPVNRARFEPHLDRIERMWHPGKGMGFSIHYSVQDPDHSSVGMEVCGRFGRRLPVEDLFQYESDSHFKCFQLETEPSTSTNIHVLGALLQREYSTAEPVIRKLKGYLEREQKKGYWTDKWHYSPYYPTSHAIIACAGQEAMRHLAETAVQWIIKTQNPDGSWGIQGPTAEETAYALQALCVWRETRQMEMEQEALVRGGQWLIDHSEPPYPPLWVGKCLYCPELVVRSAVVNALMLVEKTIQQEITPSQEAVSR